MKKYEAPEIEIVSFGVEDIVTASGNGNNFPYEGEQV